MTSDMALVPVMIIPRIISHMVLLLYAILCCMSMSAWPTTRDMMQKSRSVSHWPATRYLTASFSPILPLKLRNTMKPVMPADAASTRAQTRVWP